MGVWERMYVLLFVGVTCASPYYYRESKHHSEHHHEYSSGQDGVGVGQFSESLPNHDVTIGSPLVSPQRYTSFTSPSQSSGYLQSYGGGYSLSHGSMQHGSSYLSPEHATSVSSQRLVQQSSPIVVKQKIVKVYTYPSSSSQSGYIFSSSGSGYHGDRALSEYPSHAEKLVVVPRVQSLGSYGSGQGFYEKHQSQMEAGQKEISMDYGQEPLEQGLYIGQKEESLHQPLKFEALHSTQKMENGYKKYGTGDLEVGQSEVSEYEQKPLRDGLVIRQSEVNILQPASSVHSVGSHYSKHFTANLEVGQKEVEEFGQEPYRDSLEAGQLEVTDQKPKGSQFVLGQKSERHYEKADFERGQKETGLDELELGQKETGLDELELGQKETGLGELEVGQKETGLDELELGQKEEPILGFNYKSKHDSKSSQLDFVQKEESLYEKPIKDTFIEEGQHEDELELGQKEESLYPHSEDFDVGQKKMLEHHEKQSSHYISHGGVSSESSKTQLFVGDQEQLNFGQKEEPIMDGQREESLYLSKHSGLEAVQAPESSPKYLTSSSQRLKFNQYKKNEEAELEIGQRDETLSGQVLEDIDQTESLYKDQVSPLEVVRKEVPSHGNLEMSHQQVTNIQGKYGSGSLQWSQAEESIKRKDSNEPGQKEEPVSLYSMNYGEAETNKQTEVPAVGHPFISSYTKESSLHHKYESGNLEISQKKEPIRKEDAGQKEETLSLYSSSYDKIVPNDQKSIDLGQQRVRESFQQQGKLAIEQSNAQFFDRKVEEEDVLSGQKEEEIPFGKDHHHHNIHDDHHHNIHDHHQHKELHSGHSWHSVPCEHEKQYQHGDFGFGQEGHNKQIRNEREKFKVYSGKVASGADIQQSTGFLDLDKKVEDLAALLDIEVTTKKQSLPTLKENVEITTTSRTLPIHNAEIQELGSENFDVRSSFQSVDFPHTRVNVQETHKEEIQYEPSTSKKTYSKKHSRHYSMRQESQSSDPLVISQAGQKSSGSWYGSYAQPSFASSEIGSHYQSDQPIKRQHISQQNSQSDRHAAIDSFLTELEKDIARENKRPGQSGGFVQVSSQQHAPSQSGVTPFSDKTLYSHTSEATSSSGSGSSWLKKIGDNIGSAYNKAKDKISQSFSSAQDKAKEMVKNVKDQVSYS